MKNTFTPILFLFTATIADAQLSLQRYELDATAHGVAKVGCFTPFNGKTVFYVKTGGTATIWETGFTPQAVPVQSNYTIDMDAEFCSIGGTLYFNATNSQSPNPSRTLFQYDGTNPPSQVTDATTGQSVLFPVFMVSLNGILYFASYEGAQGALWQYEPATKKLQELNAGVSKARFLTVYNNSIYYQGDNGSDGGLYRYDPATGYSQLIAGNSFFGTNSYPSSLTVYNNKLYFAAKDAKYGEQLFEYNGQGTPQRLTGGSIHLIVEVPQAGFPSSYKNYKFIAGYNTDIYFVAYRSILQHDCGLLRYNTATKTVENIIPFKKGVYAPPAFLTPYGGALYYIDINGGSPVYKYDGNNPPADINDMQLPYTFTNASDLTVSNGALYFSAETQDTSGKRQMYVFTDAVAQNVGQEINHIQATVYPNPAQANVYISMVLKKDMQLHVSLACMNGNMVYKSGLRTYAGGKQNIVIPLGDLPAGIYNCTITGSNKEPLFNGTIQKQ